MLARFRLFLALTGLLLTALASAQEVRPGDLSGLGPLRKRYEKAAEKAGYDAWPHVIDGEKGTVVCITYDASNLDATLITSKDFPIGRLTEEGRKILIHMNRPRAAILTLSGQRTMGADLEFNVYIERQRFARKMELDLAALGAALRASELPRPIHIGIGLERAIDTDVWIGTKRIEEEKFAFFTPDELVAGSRFTAQARASWWALPGVLFGVGMIAFVFRISNSIQKLPAPETKPPAPEVQPVQDPEEVQKVYDRSRPAFLYALPMLAPVVLCGLVDAEAMMLSIEILSPVPVPYLLVGFIVAMLAGAVRIFLTVRAQWRAREEVDPFSKTPSSLQTLTILAVPALVLAIGLGIVTAIPVYTVQAMYWRRYGLIGVLTVAGLSMVAVALWRRRHRTAPAKITEGAIYETAMELARLAGTKVRGIQIVESESVNAYASLSSIVGVTRGLLDKMEPEEIRVVLAHEVGHLAYRHVARTLLLSLPFAIAFYYGWFRFTQWLEPQVSKEMFGMLASGLVPFIISNGAAAAIISPYRRRLERDADAFAVRACGDPEMVIRTLVKLHTLNESPHRLKPFDEAVSSHPSLINRIAAIRASDG